MASIPEEHRLKVIQYFERVQDLSNRMKADMANNGATVPMIAAADPDITLMANKIASEQLGFSYYPWPFTNLEPTHYEPIGEQNG